MKSISKRQTRKLFFIVLAGVLASLQCRVFSQTFENPVIIIDHGAFSDWFIDVEVNPADATVDMVYLTKPGTKYHLLYVKLFSDGTTWRSVDLAEFSSAFPPYAAVTEHDGRVFAIGVTDDGESRFSMSEDGGANFSSYAPGRFMKRADIYANDFSCHLMYVDQNNRLAYGRFDPIGKTWFFPFTFEQQQVLVMKPSISEGGNRLFAVFQGSDTLHYERNSHADGNNWSSLPNLIPNSKLIERHLQERPQLGPKSATSSQKVYAAWAGYTTQNSCCPDVRKSGRCEIAEQTVF